MNKILPFAIAATIAASALSAFAQTQRQLALPQVPSELKDVTSRANFVVLHYWDNMDFNDTGAIIDRPFMEQTFADYASILPVADLDTVVPMAVGCLLDSAAANPRAYDIILELAETYLYNYDSPFRCEIAYVPFVKKALADGRIDHASRLRYEYTLEEAAKNPPGSKLPQFEVIDDSGNQLTFQDALADRPYTLLYLFDPDCSHCTQMIAALADDPIIGAALSKGLLSVAAVNLLGPDEIYRNDELIPTRWISLAAVDPEFNETETFNLPSLPVIYLIDKDLTILLKEATPQQLISTVNKIVKKS